MAFTLFNTFGAWCIMLTIDGSHGEGGGQILRTAVALSCLTKQSIKIINIRAKRENRGLANQHITAIESVAKICNAEVRGLKKGSMNVEFFPKEIKGGKFHLNVGTAGSITLVLQACLIPSLLSNEKFSFEIIGGTDVKFAPPIDYFANVFLQILQKMNAEIKVELVRRGYYPKGNGCVNVEIFPKELKELRLEKQEIKKIKGIVHSSNLPEHIAKRIKHSALKNLIIYSYEIKDDFCNAMDAGCGITLWTEPTILGSNALGEIGIKAEILGENCSKELLNEINSGATLDIHMADQILPYLAIAKGEFLCRELSLHAQTNIWLIEQFLPIKFKIKNFGNLKRVSVE